MVIVLVQIYYIIYYSLTAEKNSRFFPLLYIIQLYHLGLSPEDDINLFFFVKFRIEFMFSEVPSGAQLNIYLVVQRLQEECSSGRRLSEYYCDMIFEIEDINIVILEIVQYKVDIITIIGQQCVAAVMGSGNNNNHYISIFSYNNSN